MGILQICKCHLQLITTLTRLTNYGYLWVFFKKQTSINLSFRTRYEREIFCMRFLNNLINQHNKLWVFMGVFQIFIPLLYLLSLFPTIYEKNSAPQKKRWHQTIAFSISKLRNPNFRNPKSNYTFFSVAIISSSLGTLSNTLTSWPVFE
jgi:hypothetical protein